MMLPPVARRAALLFVALAVPCAGVLGLGLRAIAQERELLVWSPDSRYLVFGRMIPNGRDGVEIRLRSVMTCREATFAPWTRL